IGRNFFRAVKEQGADIDIVAVNDLGSIETMAHLLMHDSVAGPYPGTVKATKSSITVDGQRLSVLSERDPADLPWEELGVDVVIESTGFFTGKAAASAHLAAGAKKVIISAPSGDADGTFVVGVNDDTYNPARQHIISNASCTTNCLAPMVKVLEEAFGLEQGLMTTIHAYTGDQQLVDGPHRDARRARAAAVNVVPTSTGAASAIGLVVKKLNGKLDGSAIRVPIPAGSLTDLTVVTKKKTDVDAINAAFKAAARSGPLRKVLDYSEAPIVSSDIVGSRASCVFDAPLTQGSGNLFKVFGWYDNETGYSHRLVDLAVTVGKKKAPAKKAAKRATKAASK
ncbi:MAG: type I glyceraldehyde-3-phosphate dehydrogenase, partial [Actinobacteria bacterium]|nr:type I glyceraldehyde-3-phosphate dehydrogenase [Actinomycetota bacterium]